MVQRRRWNDAACGHPRIAGLMLMWAVACTGEKDPELYSWEGETHWDGGKYHIEVELDTADRLSDSEGGAFETVGEVADLIRERLYLSAWQLDGTTQCVIERPYPVELVDSMQAWVGDWYAELLLPAGATCFAISATVYAETLGLDDVSQDIACDAGTDDPVQPTGSETVSIDLKVTCTWESAWYSAQ